MMTSRSLRSLSLALLAAAPALLHAQQSSIPVRELGSPESISRDTVGFLYGVRELSDGRVLVNDAGARRLMLFDRSLATYKIVADGKTDGPNSYGKRATGIIPYLADTTLLIDLAGRA